MPPTENPTSHSRNLALFKKLAEVADPDTIRRFLEGSTKIRKEIEMELSGPAFHYGGDKFKPQRDRLRNLLTQARELEKTLQDRLQSEAA